VVKRFYLIYRLAVVNSIMILGKFYPLHDDGRMEDRSMS
jgi:hypothetical protein